MRGFLAAASCGLLSLAAIGQETAGGGRQCNALAHLSLPHTMITKAKVIKAGKLTVPGTDEAALFRRLPAFCRVTAESHPSADSKILIEAWLPLAGWNERFLGVGNGGFAGSIDYHQLAVAVLRGYATAATDTGHTGSGIDATWALGHPEKIADFGYRGVHEMTLNGEAVAQAFYGKAASHRYFAACSDGGREALIEAQRFPEDYDGILAGAPAYHWTHLISGALYGEQALEGKPESYIAPTKLPAISDAVLAQCGDKEDGFVEDPRRCQFDPSVLLCKGAESDSCLTEAQLTALKALYAGPQTKDGRQVNPGEMPGAELGNGGWEPWITGHAPKGSALWGFVTGYFDDMVYDKAGLDVQTLDPDAAFDLAVKKTAGDLDAVNPDLSAFSGHGGKLILYHGWNDPAIPALGTIGYYDQVVATAGKEKADAFTRLFLVPGMQHCSGGPGIASFGQGGPSLEIAEDDAQDNIYRALEAWVEAGKAPENVIASKKVTSAGKTEATITRPLCPFPEKAVYLGSGDRASAASYVCSAGN